MKGEVNVRKAITIIAVLVAGAYATKKAVEPSMIAKIRSMAMSVDNTKKD